MDSNNPVAKMHYSASSVYLDHAATTPCLQSVVEAMAPYLTEIFANPSNKYHLPGRQAFDAVEKARSQVAASIGAHQSEVIWTSGTTESNNLAILGFINQNKLHRSDNPPPHVITVGSEHKSVLSVFNQLRALGLEVTVLSPDPHGGIDSERIKSAFRKNTILVSTMWANNELGTINPIQSIADQCHQSGIAFHTDAAQIFGKEVIDVGSCMASFVSFSPHKMGGPKGIGALYVRNLGSSRVVDPIIFGGGQENGLRSGTLNVPAIIGFGAACSHMNVNLVEESRLLASKRDTIEIEIMKELHGCRINGNQERRVPHISSITLPIREGVDVIEKLSRIACSTGSACSSHDRKPSHVLNSIGIRGQEARNTIRLSVGRTTSDENIRDAVLEIIGISRQFSSNS
jgi:cysteine desulfurase